MITPEYIYVLYNFDEHFQSDEAKLIFITEKDYIQCDYLSSCIKFDRNCDYEGILYNVNNSSLSYANEEDCVDRWPSYGDYFWDWDTVQEEFNEFMEEDEIEM